MGTNVDLDLIPDPALIVSADGRIIAANSQASAWCGYSIATLMGMGVERLIPESARARHIEHRERYNQSPRQRPMSTGKPLVACLASGAEVFVEISLGPLEGGQTVAMIRDATERISREQTYREMTTQLIDTQAEVIRILKDELRGLAQRVRALEERDSQSREP